MYEIAQLSDQYEVRRLSKQDLPAMLSLCEENPQYYRYCPPEPTKEGLGQDLTALPPGEESDEKYYVGYFQEDTLIALLDLIENYPERSKAYIGFFMVRGSVAGKGIGSGIVRELCAFLQKEGVLAVRLGWVQENVQAEHFWKKNGFRETGRIVETDQYNVVVAEKELSDDARRTC